MSIIFERVKALCLENNVSFRELERKLGFTYGTIYKLSIHSPQVSKMILISNYFNKTLDYLCGISEVSYSPIISETQASQIAQFVSAIQNIQPTENQMNALFENMLKGDENDSEQR